MKNLNRRLLLDLFKSSEGLFIFTLYQRLSTSPKELFISIEDLKQQELINENDNRLTLTQKAKDLIIENKLIRSKRNMKFENIPPDFLAPQMDINEFYIPNYFEFKNSLVNSSVKKIGGINETST